MPKPINTFPSSIRQPLVEVCWMGTGDPPFICGLHGNPCSLVLDVVEKDYIDNPDLWDSTFNKGVGNYLFEATWNPPQIGDYGRVELPGYWDMEFLEFQSVDDWIHEN